MTATESPYLVLAGRLDSEAGRLFAAAWAARAAARDAGPLFDQAWLAKQAADAVRALYQQTAPNTYALLVSPAWRAAWAAPATLTEGL